ncbi:flap endonuclease-1 [Candidatus Woesearchaeota archaeon]|nr:MAG: flap endonuclease-1 [Candidatus Woesearchaeota archaeon]
MGVNLGSLIKGREISISELAGKVLAVDASMWIHQFLASIRAPDGTLFCDKKGRTTSHLIGLSSRIANLLEANIKLVFCFDGKPPELKLAEKERRTAIKEEALKQYREALIKGELEEARKYAMRTTTLTDEIIASAKKLISAFGLPIIQAPQEADAQAAYLVKQNDAFAVSTNDYDALLFGAPRMVKNISIYGKKIVHGRQITIKPELIILSALLQELGINHDQLIALGILIGTDYNPGGIHGIGPKRALELVKQFKCDFKALFAHVKWSSLNPVDWSEIFNIFKSMPVEKNYRITFKEPDKKAIEKILIEEYDFSEERVKNIIEKAIKEQKGLQKWL